VHDSTVGRYAEVGTRELKDALDSATGLGVCTAIGNRPRIRSGRSESDFCPVPT